MCPWEQERKAQLRKQIPRAQRSLYKLIYLVMAYNQYLYKNWRL